MKVVILCGGRGTRLREETEFRPKPMLPIGNRPILWHIMKTYAHHGHKDFILCLGYKGDMIRDYFRNYLWNTCDTTLSLGIDSEPQFHTSHQEEDWTVTLADTGENSMTAYRIRLIEKYLEDDAKFLLTYGDGVGNMDINASIRFHEKTGRICAMTAVHPPGRFGELGLDEGGGVHGFNEKPQAEGGYINGGYMVCSRDMFKYLPDDPGMMLEQDPMRKLTADCQLAAFRHEGFWQPMDTFQEFNLLNSMWKGERTLENLVTFAMAGAHTSAGSTEPFGGIFRGRSVLVTGHTGFKGSWLCEWLLGLGAQVAGIGLAPNTEPALFQQLGLEARLEHHIQDIRQAGALTAIIRDFRPDFVFHLAAQPIVRLSYEQPVETWETNVLGTVHVLEALRLLDHPCAAVFVTTDKCYENREWLYAYREVDHLGGHDPYSSSKAGAEIAIAAWRRSFFQGSAVKIASARAGNVIGGGDWAQDRIVPDCMRALSRGETIPVRNKTATRPWQHVLEPLAGYLWLAALLADPSLAGQPAPDPVLLREAFNFGPRLESNRTVADLVVEILKHRPGQWEDRSNPHAPHEASLLNLSIEKAFHLLHWSPVWDFAETIAHTTDWYTSVEQSPDSPLAQTRAQIAAYCAAARAAGILWSRA